MLTVVIVAAVLLAALWFGQRGLIYFPMSDVPAPAAVGLPRADPFSFTTDDGLHLDGWFVPGREPSANRTVIVFNGNAGHRGYRAPFAATLAEHGISTILFDYRGYGGNPGLPSEEGLVRDAQGVLRFAASHPEIDLSRIVYFGESLGAAVAVRLAVEFPPAALVLRSPFSSLTELGQRHYPFLPVRWLLRDRYPTIDLIPLVTSPLLVIAGDDDRIVPLEDTEALYEAAPYPKKLVVIPDAGHNDEALAYGAQVIRALVDFLDGG
jgi:fermentation-respiration switch protein FrsA (DUF1100 family)